MHVVGRGVAAIDRTGPTGISPSRVGSEMGDQEIEKAADLGRQMVPMRVDRADRVLGTQKLGQRWDQPAGSDLVNQ